MMEDLISSIEIAEIAKVRKQTVSNWKKRHKDFPPPVTHKLYSKREIINWLNKREKEK